jgi:hypothetical protein
MILNGSDMNAMMKEDIKRWTARRKAARVRALFVEDSAAALTAHDSNFETPDSVH